MSDATVVLAVGVVDALGVAGTSGVCASWSGLETVAPGTGRTFRRLFGRPDASFRRLDAVSRALVLAAEAAGLAQSLPEDARDDTALVFESALGCLETDLRFARSLAGGIVEGPLFPYTLPSTCLGEVALRHRLRGPSLCLSVAEEGAALAEGVRLLDAGEARFALVGSFEVLREGAAGLAATLRAVVALIAGAGEDRAAVAPWPHGARAPFTELAAGWRRARAPLDAPLDPDRAVTTSRGTGAE
jgi:hypothetical protein